jgi:cyanophycin synthetase
VQERVAEYRRYWETGATALGAEFLPITDEVWDVRRNGRRARIYNFLTPCDDPGTRRLAGDKVYCYALARRAGLPVPEHAVIRPGDLAAARGFLARHPPPYVVKPARDTSSGLGVTTRVRTWGEVLQAAALASLYTDEILLERMMPGQSCRLLYLDGRLIHAVRRRGLAGPAHAASPVQELRTVYDETVTSLCGEPLVSECAGVMAALGTEFAGIDLVCNDLRQSLRVSGGTFLEINTTPGIHHHYITEEDHTVNPVAMQVLAYLLQDRRPDGARHGKD